MQARRRCSCIVDRGAIALIAGLTAQDETAASGGK